MIAVNETKSDTRTLTMKGTGADWALLYLATRPGRLTKPQAKALKEFGNQVADSMLDLQLGKGPGDTAE